MFKRNAIKIWLYIGLVALLFLVGAVVPASVHSAAAAEKPALTTENNLLIFTGQKDFSAGSFSGTELDNKGSIVLQHTGSQYFSTGIYTSSVITCESFKKMVMSWNVDTPEGTVVSVEAQIFLNKKWTPWLSWGRWSTTEDSGSVKSSIKSLLAMDTDTLLIKDGQTATALRYRIKLESKSATHSPTIRLVAIAVRGNEPHSLPVNKNLKKADIVLDVPQYSQKQRDPKISGRICSPTSLAMILNYYGVNVIPEETAWGVMDYAEDIFGNWPFNCAYAGSFGLRSYVAYYTSLEDIKRDILAGRPVAASVMYKKSESVAENLPVLHNAPIEATHGHLVVVRGFVQKDGKEYVVVNDPAAYENQAVKRLYLAKEFEAAWNKVVYIVAKQTDAIIQPKRIAANIKYTGDTLKSKDGTIKSKALLEVAGLSVDLSPEHVRSIVILKANGKAEFLQANQSRSLWLNKQEKNASIIVITDNHKVYQAIID